MAKVVKVLIIAAMISGLFGVAPAAAGGSSTVEVTNGAASGEGSYAAAIEAANADRTVSRIVFDEHLMVTVDGSVVYTGKQKLTIVGNGSTISGASVADDATWDGGLFASTGPTREITIRDLVFADSPNNGVAVFIPEGHGGTVRVKLTDVAVTDAQFHGVFVDGQSTTGFNTDNVLQNACADPHPFDSNSKIDVTLRRVTVDGAGDLADSFDISIETGCPQDFDGVRVDQGGPRSLLARIVDSTFTGNLADGVELDETGEGKVDAHVSGSTFAANGETLPVSYLEDGELVEVTDLDDGFDIDEAGPGNLIARVVDTVASHNRDEGLDFDEAGDGRADVTVVGVTAEGNMDEGVKVDEEDAGKLNFSMRDSTVSAGLDNDGVQLSEQHDGSLVALIRDSSVVDHEEGDGIKAEESGLGKLELSLKTSTVTGNKDGLQIVESEEGDQPTDGNLFVLVKGSTVTDNSGAGVKAEQSEPGTGTLRIRNSDLSGNDDGETDLEGVVVD